HESPKLHGFNRTSWKIADMALAYKEKYLEAIGETTISTHLKRMGFGFEKSRELLTSPDPKFREKVEHIKEILANLGENERFFSVDEYGHFSVKLRGGRSIVKKGQRKIIPQLQHSKGFLIVTAALELSTNQVTHFYSRKKDTDEMIKLLDILLDRYKGTSKVYFSWDKAAWHASKKLFARIDEVNKAEFRMTNNSPIVELAPLPASAQFLNVIESVFSGLAKAVIHNSDYQSLDECMAAIDRHFKERNEHFQKNPKKAGGFIWGKEMVKPVFSETNTCKKPGK
ncbi:MAG: IS630 family transposase, partial [Bacteroidetes bacterium]|nr:IS630 family transposase [Bacteroidota bacterium]